MISKKSQSFILWLRNSLKVERNVGGVELLAGLELAARIVTHDIDTMGEPSEESLRALARASKLLEETYGKV